MKKRLKAMSVLLIMMLLFSGCDTDVVGKYAVTSFDKILEYSQVAKDKNQTSIITSNGDIFEFGLNGTFMKLSATPFLNAGLDITKLPETIVVDLNYLIIKQDYTASDFKTLVSKYRDKIGYHEEFDHYNIDFGNGNKFEWAKDLENNTLDIVFVLNAIPFKEAGVNVTQIEGFTYQEEEGKNGEKEYKLIESFDLDAQEAFKQYDGIVIEKNSISKTAIFLP